MKKGPTAIWLLLLFSTTAEAQFTETLKTGRPGQAIGAYTTGKGVFQVLSGFDYYNLSNSATGIETSGLLNQTAFRFGPTEKFELNALIEYRTGSKRKDGVDSSMRGLSALDVGLRYHIMSGEGLVPNVGLQLRVALPVLEKPYEIPNAAPQLVLALSQQLSEKFMLITNWGGTWNGNDSSPVWKYVINLSFPFNAHFGAFVESYGTLVNGTLSTNFDTGIAWLLTNDLQLDLYGGFGNNGHEKQHFISTGVSWRIKPSHGRNE